MSKYELDHLIGVHPTTVFLQLINTRNYNSNKKKKFRFPLNGINYALYAKKHEANMKR